MGAALQRLIHKKTRESSLLFRLERGPGIALQAMQEKKALSSRPRLAHADLASLAPHERLPEILVVPREKTSMGAAGAIP